MKTRTAYRKKELFHTYNVRVWVAASWVLTGNLLDALTDKAYESCGRKRSDRYTHEMQIRGSPSWDFEVKIYTLSWVCAEEDK